MDGVVRRHFFPVDMDMDMHIRLFYPVASWPGPGCHMRQLTVRFTVGYDFTFESKGQKKGQNTKTAKKKLLYLQIKPKKKL